MEELSPQLIHSFAKNRGSRGAHFYDSEKCEFVDWTTITSTIRPNLPESFYEKLVEAVANYDPESEFITVSAGGGQITIELFKAEPV